MTSALAITKTHQKNQIHHDQCTCNNKHTPEISKYTLITLLDTTNRTHRKHKQNMPGVDSC